MSTSFTQIAAGLVIAEKYKLVRRLGEGSMGVVWAALNLSTSREVALKLIHRPDAELRRRLQREGRNGGALRHRNVIDMYDMGETEFGEPFLVMQLLTGETLAELLVRRRRLDADVAASIGRDVARGLAAVHALHIVHRDLKPANIFLHREADADEPVVKVLDFGVAKNLAVNDGIRTATGGAVGSPLYMSPEQVRAEPNVDHRADIWSLGVVLFEMLTGMRPFQGDARAVFTGILTGEIPKISRYVRRVDPGLVELVARCMARHRDERIGSAAEIADLLDGYTAAGARARAGFAVGGGGGGSGGGGQVAAMEAPAFPGATPAGAAVSPTGSGAAVSPTGSGVPVSPTGSGAPVSPMASGAVVSPTASGAPVSPTASGAPMSPMASGAPVSPMASGASAPEWNAELTQRLEPEAMASAEAALGASPAWGHGEPGKSTTAPLVPGPEAGRGAQPSPWAARATPVPLQAPQAPPRRQAGWKRLPGPAIAALAAGAAGLVGAALFVALRSPAPAESAAGIAALPEAGIESAATNSARPPDPPPPPVTAAPQASAEAEAPKVDEPVDAGGANSAPDAGPAGTEPAPVERSQPAVEAPTPAAAAPVIAAPQPAAAPAPAQTVVAAQPRIQPPAQPSPAPSRSAQQPAARRQPVDPCAGKTGFMRTNCLRDQAKKKDPYAP
ncbi:Protein kinase [Sorangium cellulosum So ce56]|uniref:Protein kinase n=1 Tax=Sorangium cellulosum (strain So ce56) TaxID=448385 RepID=A9FDH5_SORC5|nr:serine/threonine-protein kinase [Sorangium cellulosum]CAN91762.1 Protein kinase [Sorangium cellulosum So ce56]